ncbi:hypothetical protein [Leifsonia sp. NPDC058230]|uniref:hypothetical protein n=1 Tax=Leifsonia sp. NPDC058230 TaxID=3346391 RepID=UPI0036DAD6EA
MSGLTRAYLNLLAWYSPEWRAEYGDAMLGTLLDQADAESRTRVSLVERAELIVGGLRERLLSPRRLTWPNVVALSAATVLSLYYFSVTWSPGSLAPGFIGPFANPSVITGVLIVGAFVGLMLSRPASVRVLALASVFVEVGVGVLAHTFNWFGPSWSTVLLFVGLALLAALPLRRTRTAIAAAASVGIVVAATVFLPIVFELRSDLLFWSLVTLLSILTVTGVAYAVTKVRVRQHSID